MELSVKKEIGLMLIPIIGTWWVIARILPDLKPITWWDVSRKALPTILAIALYQAICWGLLKYIN
jgi:uncharacterized membrane protein